MSKYRRGNFLLREPLRRATGRVKSDDDWSITAVSIFMLLTVEVVRLESTL